jgi:DUF4097 and DUF4098 domain-containing protein YvlB
MRHFAFAALLFFAFAAFARADEWTKTYDLTGKPELRVEARDASLRIEPWDQNKIEVHVTTRGWKIGGGGLEIVEHQQGNSVEIELRGRQHNHISFGIDTQHTDVEIRMPRNGKVNAHTEDGRITARGLAGELDFSTSDGRLELEDLDGSLHAHTSDGSVRASGRFDVLSLRTDDGHIDVNVHPGSQLRESWEIRTSDGGVRVAIPADLAADIELHTGDGHITTNIPITVEGSFGSHDLRGKLNGGGNRLTIHTGDGSITVDKS